MLDQKTITTQVNGNVLDIDSGRGVNMATLNQVWSDGCLFGSDRINGYPPVNYHSPSKSPSLLSKYHQHGGFSMAIYGKVGSLKSCNFWNPLALRNTLCPFTPRGILEFSFEMRSNELNESCFFLFDDYNIKNRSLQLTTR